MIYGLFIVILVILCVLYVAILYRLRRLHVPAVGTRSQPDDELSAHNQIESLINNITDGVIAVDKNMRIFIYNAAALDLLDLNTQIRGQKLEDLFKPVDAKQQPVDIIKLLEAAKTPTTNRDLRIKYADGSVANLFLGISPIYLGYGKSLNNGYTLMLRDITREKSLEEERDEFISVVSHELRTPIAIAEGNIGNAEFIAKKSGDIKAVQQGLKEAHDQVLFLADMINDLATLSRAERGKLQLEVTSIDVPELIKSLQTSYQPQIQAKGLTLEVYLDQTVSKLSSSQLYVREILQNFITNAIKYTKEGNIKIRVESQPNGLNFIVQDSGIGISKSDQEKVFDKFFRSEDFRTREVNGTGLGLYVTAKLARLIHANIELASELNKGSAFKVYIPNLKP